MIIKKLIYIIFLLFFSLALTATEMIKDYCVGYFEEGFDITSSSNSTTTQTLTRHKGSVTKLMSNTKIFREAQEVLYIPVLANLSVNSGSDTLTGATTVNFKNGGTTVSSANPTVFDNRKEIDRSKL